MPLKPNKRPKNPTISLPTNLRWSPDKQTRDAMSRAKDIDPKYRLEKSAADKEAESSIQDLQIVATSAKLKPRSGFFGKIAAMVGLKKRVRDKERKFSTADIGSPKPQSLEVAFGEGVKNSVGLDQMLKTSKAIKGSYYADNYADKNSAELKRGAAPADNNASFSSDCSSEENWPSSSEESLIKSEDSTVSEVSTALEDWETKTPEANNKDKKTQPKLLEVIGKTPKFYVKLNLNIVTTTRNIRRITVKEAPPPPPIFLEKKPKVAPKPTQESREAFLKNGAQNLPKVDCAKINPSPSILSSAPKPSSLQPIKNKSQQSAK